AGVAFPDSSCLARFIHKEGMVNRTQVVGPAFSVVARFGLHWIWCGLRFTGDCSSLRSVPQERGCRLRSGCWLSIYGNGLPRRQRVPVSPCLTLIFGQNWVKMGEDQVSGTAPVCARPG